MNLLSLNLTAALAVATTNPIRLAGAPRNLTVQGNFNYGSGGTSVDAYVQTSVDLGLTWTDIAQFHFTMASARFLFNLSAATPKTSQVTPTDGTLAANSAVDGILGGMLRVKYQSSGTYVGSTLSIDAASIDLPA